MTVIADIGDNGMVTSTAVLRTARKLFDGTVFAP
jgi:2-methylaconitate cis-trans-isomerase PrpF